MKKERILVLVLLLIVTTLLIQLYLQNNTNMHESYDTERVAKDVCQEKCIETGYPIGICRGGLDWCSERLMREVSKNENL